MKYDAFEKTYDYKHKNEKVINACRLFLCNLFEEDLKKQGIKNMVSKYGDVYDMGYNWLWTNIYELRFKNFLKEAFKKEFGFISELDEKEIIPYFYDHERDMFNNCDECLLNRIFDQAAEAISNVLDF